VITALVTVGAVLLVGGLVIYAALSNTAPEPSPLVICTVCVMGFSAWEKAVEHLQLAHISKVPDDLSDIELDSR
jgi:xanthosine utilization system XapX-like protein